MKIDAWVIGGLSAVAAIMATVLLAVELGRIDPAEACRVQTLASEERITNRLWLYGHMARKDAAAIRSAVAKLPQRQEVNGLPLHWQGTVRAEQ